MVPNGWKLGTIEEISSVSSGGTPSRKNESYWNGNIPWVTTAEVKFNIIEDTAEKITEEGLANSSAKLFPVDTILIAMYGQGKTRGQVAKLGIEASTNQACAAIILKAGYRVDYYYQFLISQYDNIREMANSGGQENLSGGIVKSIKVPVPPLPEQNKIAQILSTWDKVISTTEQLLANSQQQKKALMQQLLTGKKRLLDSNGVRFSGEWVHGRLGELCTFKGGSAFKEEYQGHSEGDLPFIKVSDMNLRGNEKYIGYANNWLTDQAAKELKAKAFPKDTIVFAKVGAALLLNRRRILFRPTIIDNNMMAAIPTKFGDTEFIYQLMLAVDFAKLVQEGAVPSVNQGDLASFKISYPEKEEQQKIAAVLSTAEQEITALRQELAALKQEKKALMQQLLTGKRRVKVEEAA
ncbi:TPA: restriction endonuclease subunit S [Aeromonas sobria]|nr:restriction endonuclease subunit S [Aeromonas sobria]HEH9402365.1 restriction endonuclease subunit S [Aeromonas sobria]